MTVSKVIPLDEFNFKTEVLEGEGVILVDFWAPWCGPCEMLEPILDELSDEVEAKICKVNVDEQSALASEYEIRSIPAMIVFKNGERIDRLTGFMHEDAIKEKLESY